MVAAVLSAPKASRKMTELSGPDRSWLVAGLTDAGVTAQDIADRLGCSLRLVRSIRAEDMTQMAWLWLESERKAADDLRAEKSEHALTRRELAESERECARLRTQHDQLVIKLQRIRGRDVTFGCGHPMVDYNTYKSNGRRYCKECRRKREAVRRARRRAPTCAMVSSVTTQQPSAAGDVRLWALG